MGKIKVRLTPAYLNFRSLYYYFHGYRGIGDPLRIYYVAPDDIRYTIGSSSFEDPPGAFAIRPGDWDLNKRSVEKSEKLSMFRKHFEKSIPWEETEEYQRKQNEIGERKIRTLDVDDQSTDVYDEYLNYMENLYQRIQQKGYKSQRELSTDDDFANRQIHPALNEIQVMVGRDGELLCNTGLHRLAIAKIQGIERIPVRTQCRHRRWQQLRDELYTASSSEDVSSRACNYIEHPELADITEAMKST